MRLQTKLCLALVPLIVAPLLTFGAIAYVQVRDSGYERTVGQMTTLLEQTGEQVRLKTSTAVANVGLLGKNSLVQKYTLTSDPLERASLLQRPLLRQLSRFQAAFPDYDEIRLMDADGSESLRWNSDPWALERPTPEDAVLTKLRDSRQAQAVFLRESGHTRLIAATPLYLHTSELTSFSAKPQLHGYLSLTVDLDFLARQLEEQVFADTGRLLVVDASGRPLLSPPRAQQLVAADESVPPAVRQALVATSTAAPQVVSWGGRSMLINATPLPGGAYLLAATPEAEVLAAGRRIGRQVVFITLLAALLTPLLVLWALQRMVLKPLLSLSSAADTMGRGELDAPVVVASRDEMGALARRFDQMRENLRDTTAALAYKANHDSLTGLPNRRRLDDYLQQALAGDERRSNRLALLFLDLDGFKLINDNLGHGIGDALLRALSKRLIGCLRQADRADGEVGPDLISRVGGDEFVIVIDDLRDPNGAGRVADRILAVVHEPLEISGHQLQVGASIGIALCPVDGDTADELIGNADIAMYQAKGRGRNCAVYFSSELGGSFQRRLSLELRLRRAIEQGELELYFQPQVDTASGRIVGLEALARWTDPEVGSISPGEFIPLAEETGLILPLTAWALDAACRQSRIWQAQGLAGVPIAVNMPGSEILTGEGVTLVERALAATGLAADRLEVEITETTLLSSENRAVRELTRLREMGVGLALDDFGTGYSSLGYLRRLPFNKLKIDRGFVAGVDSSDANAAIVAAVIAMAHALDMNVVAEGVEHASQWHFLAKHRCEAIQGFLFSRPVDSCQAARLLAQTGLPLPTAGAYPGVTSISGQRAMVTSRRG